MNRMSVARRSPGTVPCAAAPERMFPVDESGPGQPPTPGERAAVAVCAACPVLAVCRVAVLGMPLAYGVAGGLTAAQRR
ncbi:MAG: WhiB family transcriptional regulator, partial [Actinomycetia bacterium]|nr:WhiB family transcriptional regulator [Actinomycetes bacterium]